MDPDAVPQKQTYRLISLWINGQEIKEPATITLPVTLTTTGTPPHDDRRITADEAAELARWFAR